MPPDFPSPVTPRLARTALKMAGRLVAWSDVNVDAVLVARGGKLVFER